MQQIIARELTVTRDREIATDINPEYVTVAEVLDLLQHLLAESIAARAQPGQTTELFICVAADGQHVQIGGRVLVRWIVSERRRVVDAARGPL